ncbi:MAG: translocation/assembly module TamB domain-containing protein [Bacteroidota bacterium]
MEQTQLPDSNPSPEPKGDGRRSILRWTWWLISRTALFFFSLFFIVYIALQIPYVQNWAATRITSTLSKTLETRVELDRISISFFDKLVLNGLYVEDYNQDTLIYSQELLANINTNPISYFQRGLEIEEINLATTRFFIRRPRGSDQNTLQQVLAKLVADDKEEEKDKEKKPFQLNLDLVRLDDVHFIQDDDFRGQLLSIYIGQGEIDIEHFDLPNERIYASYVEIREPKIRIDEKERDPAYYTIPEEVEVLEEIIDTTTFQLAIRELRFHDGTFVFNNFRNTPTRLKPMDEMDYDHLEVFDINFEVDSFFYDIDEYIYKGIVRDMRFKEASGFELSRLEAKDVEVSPSTTSLRDMTLVTPYSRLGDSLILEYDSFLDYTDYVDSVYMKIYLSNSAVAFRDIIVFAPALKENTFFMNNREEILVVDGLVFGTVNQLAGRNLLITLADGTTIDGRFNSNNLAVRDEERMDISLRKLVTSMSTMRQILPNFNPPSTFDKLGRLEFTGDYYGFFEDFVAFGNLNTDLGKAELDMHLNVREGKEKAKYNGYLSLEDFDLGKWTGNADLGIINFRSDVLLGSTGLTANTADAQVKAEISDVFFKGYQYKNAKISGELQRNLFNGDFNIQDENIDFAFRGKLDFTDSIPEFDFDASVNKLDLQAVNILKQNYEVSGDFKLQLINRRDEELQGTGTLNNIIIVHDDTSQYLIDYVTVSSLIDTSGAKQFAVDSDLMNANVEGDFDVLEIPKALQAYAQTHFPGFSNQLGFKDSIKLKDQSIYNFDIFIKDTKGLQELLIPKLSPITGTSAKGQFSDSLQTLQLELELPQLTYDDFTFTDIFLLMDTKGAQGNFEFVVYDTKRSEQPFLAPVTVLSILNGDTLDFGLNVRTNSANIIDNLNFNGELALIDSSYFELNLSQSNLAILEDIWVLDKDNKIIFSRDSIFIDQFELYNQERKVRLNSTNGKMVNLQLERFNFNVIDDYWDYEPLDFEGYFSAEIQVQDIFQLKGLHADVSSDTLFINDDDFGRLRIDVDAEDIKHPLYANVNITKDTTQLLAEGYYNLPTVAEGAPNKYEFETQITSFPLAIAEYFIGNNVSDIVGSIDAEVRFFGGSGKPNISGYAYVPGGAFTIDYLKTRYSFINGNVAIDNKLFDASGLILRDRLGNTAQVFGGIAHNNLSNFGVNARLDTKSFLALDTGKEDNPLYYGKAIGAGNIIFTGPFNRTDIFIDASIGEGTKIILPLAGGSVDARKLDFIEFVQRNEQTDKEKLDKKLEEQLGGLSIEMNLTINEKAQMNLVFNEQTGDIIQGNGRGNIQILVPRGGQLQMFGEYIIESGSYLFTLYNIASKQFKVKRGGTIQWAGDPFKAQINLEAEYGDISTSVANFIQEYLLVAPEDVIDLATQSTNVDLEMKLRGELLKPVINFDIAFPQLQGELLSYTDSKLRLLRQDQNELNRQVFGLIVVGQFLPGDFSFSGSDVIYNTLSEFVSNQLSLLITDLFSEVLEDGRVLSGIDFDVAYYQSQSVNFGNGQDVDAGEEFQVSQRLDFFNDRLTVIVGGNVELGNNVQAATGNTGTFVGNDLVIEYSLNDDRSLKLRIYQRLQPDIGGGRRLQLGTGLSFRREFNTFSEFFKSFKKDAGSVKEENQ